MNSFFECLDSLKKIITIFKIYTMKNILIWFIFLLVCFSCKEKPYETLQILVQNRTETFLYITLYPKTEYLAGSLYHNSDESGGYTNTEYTLSPNIEGYSDWSEVLFVTGNLDIEPYQLAKTVFDSIYISNEDKGYTLRFTHDNVTGYQDNLFSESSTWDYEMLEDELPTMFRHNPQIYYCYRFIISEDKILISDQSE